MPFQGGNNQQLRKLEAKPPLNIILRQQLCPFPHGWCHVVKKKKQSQPLRGLESDDNALLSRSLTARQKANFLELMLGQIANYCPIISHSTLVKNSTALKFIWQTIRQHFGFQVTGAQFIDFSDIHLAADEHHEDLRQRLMAFVEDSLLRANGLTHHDEDVLEDEELTPTLENFVILTWLTLIHPSLPRLVKQWYGTELRSHTLASIKPEISQALNSLLEEIRTSDDARILCAAVAVDFRYPIRLAGMTLSSALDNLVRTNSASYANKLVALTQTTSSVSIPFSLKMTGASW